MSSAISFTIRFLYAATWAMLLLLLLFYLHRLSHGELEIDRADIVLLLGQGVEHAVVYRKGILRQLLVLHVFPADRNLDCGSGPRCRTRSGPEPCSKRLEVGIGRDNAPCPGVGHLPPGSEHLAEY